MALTWHGVKRSLTGMTEFPHLVRWRSPQCIFSCCANHVAAVLCTNSCAGEVSFMLFCWSSSSPVEQDFSFLEMYSAKRKGSASTANLKPGAQVVPNARVRLVQAHCA